MIPTFVIIIQGNLMNRAILYFFYDGEGIVDEYNLFLLRDLKKSCKKIYIVVNGILSDEGKHKFETVADNIYVRENKGMDVWAYKEGMQHIGWDIVTSYDEFIMMNHTNYGPVYSTTEMFSEMEKRDIDFWGITKHNGHATDPYNACEYGYIPPHIQSSFIAVRKRMLKSEDFKRYWDNMPMIQGYIDSICRHEAVFTEKFTRLGYSNDVYVNTDDLKDVCDYPLMIMPVELIKNRRCPVFKRKSFFNIYEELMDCTCGQPTMELYDYLRNETDYDVNMVWDNLLRTANMWDIKQRMQLNYILPRQYSMPLKTQPKVALFMHVYYIDMISEMREFASYMPPYADIYISTSSQEKKQAILQAMESLNRKIVVVVVKNRGREYAGFFIGLREYVSKYDYICIVHGKKSRYEKPYIIGDSFAFHCIENTLSSTEYINNILATFEDNPRLGLIVPPVPEHAMYFSTIAREWRNNYSKTVKLLEELGINVPIAPDKPPVAPLGGFLWFRTKAMKKLFDYPFTYDVFPEEPCTANDGTIMHAIERVYPYVAQEAGYYSAWGMSDRYACLKVTNSYKTIRDINEVVFWNYGETDRHGLMKILIEDMTIAKAARGDTSLGTRKQVLRIMLKTLAGPKWCARYRRLKNRIWRLRK